LSLRVYCLSMPSAVTRKKELIYRFQPYGLNFDFISPPIINSIFSEILIENPELSCAAGHLKIYKKFLESSEVHAIIFEDDVIPSDCFHFDYLTDICNFVGQCHNPTIAFLGGQEGLKSRFYITYQKTRKQNASAVRKTFKSAEFIKRTCCYIVNREAAQIILNRNLKLNFVADEWVNLAKGFDLYMARPIQVLHPVDLQNSDIQEFRDKMVNSLSFCSRVLGVMKRILQKIWREIETIFL